MSVDGGATISVRSLSPLGERVGVRGLQNYRETLTPHPNPLPAEVGFIRLRPLSEFLLAFRDMRFTSETREGPYFRVSTRPIVKHLGAP